MNESVNVLIVDDHPFIIDVFKNALAEVKKRFINTSFNFKISEATNCEDAIRRINQAAQPNSPDYDLVFLDIRLPPAQGNKVMSGEDLGEMIRTYFPKAKLLIFTSHNENIRLISILNHLNPDGFLIKSDVSYIEAINAIQSILNDTPYYSKTILNLLRTQIASGIIIDKVDKQILYELSVGTKMKDLPKIIPMSMAGLERRKRLLKNIFNIPNEDDKALIATAKENGFV